MIMGNHSAIYAKDRTRHSRPQDTWQLAAGLGMKLPISGPKDAVSHQEYRTRRSQPEQQKRWQFPPLERHVAHGRAGQNSVRPPNSSRLITVPAQTA